MIKKSLDEIAREKLKIEPDAPKKTLDEDTLQKVREILTSKRIYKMSRQELQLCARSYETDEKTVSRIVGAPWIPQDIEFAEGFKFPGDVLGLGGIAEYFAEMKKKAGLLGGELKLEFGMQKTILKLSKSWGHGFSIQQSINDPFISAYEHDSQWGVFLGSAHKVLFFYDNPLNLSPNNQKLAFVASASRLKTWYDESSFHSWSIQNKCPGGVAYDNYIDKPQLQCHPGGMLFILNVDGSEGVRYAPVSGLMLSEEDKQRETDILTGHIESEIIKLPGWSQVVYQSFLADLHSNKGNASHFNECIESCICFGYSNPQWLDKTHLRFTKEILVKTEKKVKDHGGKDFTATYVSPLDRSEYLAEIRPDNRIKGELYRLKDGK